MPQQVDREGTFRFRILDHAVSETKNGHPQFVARLQVVEYYDEDTSEWLPWAEYEMEALLYQVLFYPDDKEEYVASRNVNQCMAAFGWDGQSLTGLNDMDLSSVIFRGRVAAHEYNGKVSLRVEWIDANGDDALTQTMKRLDAKSLSDLDSKFGGLLGGKKTKAPAKAPAKAPVAPPKKVASKPADPIPATDTDADRSDETAESSPTSDAPSTPEPPAKGKGKRGKKTAVPAGAEITIVDKATAWESCCKLKREDVTDEQFTSAFLTAMEAQGGDEDAFTAEQWLAIRDATLDEIPHYKF